MGRFPRQIFPRYPGGVLAQPPNGRTNAPVIGLEVDPGVEGRFTPPATDLVSVRYWAGGRSH